MGKRLAVKCKVREADIFKRLCFALAIGTIIAMGVMFEFKDFDSITAWSFNVWDLIFDKDLGLKDFYSYRKEKPAARPPNDNSK